ncbi:hypothetical protein O7632_18545 [Solwaraspora sp. WMMD406]|uniref:hypothetical protein n=1 Tax=Solwaraspora sp. WMMD406 TaxID=3016095 RepID=UPI002415A5A3|nr:hypothetical protein [Solwaraspora sp. WMMD406]MDG4766087.1 hypothetical protein [Solwaraspora sp. WMMD406]
MTGSVGTGVDTLVLGRPELVPRSGPVPPAEPWPAGRPARPANSDHGRRPTAPGRPAGESSTSAGEGAPPPSRDRTTSPPGPARDRSPARPGGRPGGAPPSGAEIAAARPGPATHLTEFRVVTRGANGVPTEIGVVCAVDRRTGTIHLRLPDGSISRFDLLLARAAGLVLHEAVMSVLDHRGVRLWVRS